MATAAISREPLQQTNGYQLGTIHQSVQFVQDKRFDLLLADLIYAAHMPEASVVTEDQRRAMALKMRQLRQILVGCQPAEPKTKHLFDKGEKRFKHPNDSDIKGKYLISSLFTTLTQTAQAVKRLRGGLDLSQIGEGNRIVRHFFTIKDMAKGSLKPISSIFSYSTELRCVTQEHWGKIWNDPASYGIGQIYKERVEMVFKAIDNNQLVVEEALSAEYLRLEEKEQARAIASIAKLQVDLIRAKQRTAAAYRAAAPSYTPPAPVPFMGPITANTGWSPSNGADYTARSNPAGLQFFGNTTN